MHPHYTGMVSLCYWRKTNHPRLNSVKSAPRVSPVLVYSLNRRSSTAPLLSDLFTWVRSASCCLPPSQCYHTTRASSSSRLSLSLSLFPLSLVPALSRSRPELSERQTPFDRAGPGITCAPPLPSPTQPYRKRLWLEILWSPGNCGRGGGEGRWKKQRLSSPHGSD
jgi:hypothetical protein